MCPTRRNSGHPLHHALLQLLPPWWNSGHPLHHALLQLLPPWWNNGHPLHHALLQLLPRPDHGLLLRGETPAQKLFDRIDADGLGLLLFDEFGAWWFRRQQATSIVYDEAIVVTMKARWEELDADGSGELDVREVEQMMKSLASSQWHDEAVDDATGAYYYYMYHTVTKEREWDSPESEFALTDFMSQNGMTVPQRRKPLQQMGQKVGPIAVAALRGGVSAAHTIIKFTAWRTAYPHPPPRGPRPSPSPLPTRRAVAPASPLAPASAKPAPPVPTPPKAIDLCAGGPSVHPEARERSPWRGCRL